MAFLLRKERGIAGFLLGRSRSSSRRWMSTISHEVLSAGEDRDDVKTAVLVHGLMGAGKNLRGFAKELLRTVMERSHPNSSGWQLVLVDLRNHGNSANLAHLKPPHNIQSAASDIVELIKTQLGKWPNVVMGHSLGGKVALEFGEGCANGLYGSSAIVPSQLWVLDTVPGKINIVQNGEVERVLNTIQNLPDPLPSRRWLVEYLVKDGFSKPLADWLSSNLKRVDTSSTAEMTWIFDVRGIYDMYQSYRETCYWPLLESPPMGTDIGIVRAEKSDRWYPEILSQLEEIAQANNTPRSNVGTISYHILENAGHWLHVDNPNGLIEILAPSLVRIASP